MTATKIEIHSGVPSERLLELLPTTTLPREYGGTNETAYPATLISGAAAKA